MTIDTSKFRAPQTPLFKRSVHPTRALIFADKAAAKASIKADAKAISSLSHKLYAESKRALLIVLQGMDTSGKDGTTKALFSRTAPLNIRVEPFKAPSKRELAHDYLWRVHKVCPAKGQITVFNRSHYEDVLVVKVRGFAPKDAIKKRYAQINGFEKHLSENGTVILKFMLNISKREQGIRLAERLEQPHKYWKFNPGDLEDRLLWPKFMKAYELMVRKTNTAHAPWYIIPSDDRATRNAIICRTVRETLEAMNPAYPDPGYRPGDFVIG
ncbi:MAG TPA: polyphosphate kinase 2 family protein [Hellea balneolensis]|uniref:Polyphosphate kinase 2 family protein n=1 Tax=Hellea balneolensis TaxID=287478 RepID=A0A7C5LTX5_9PROT|nr:polyphosphate kinase 2 family protein [Hellea balneolensis]